VSEPNLNYGWSWRNWQFLWRGWHMRRSFYFARCRAPLDKTYRWTVAMWPLEIRRWAEDYRDVRRRLGVEP